MYTLVRILIMASIAQKIIADAQIILPERIAFATSPIFMLSSLTHEGTLAHVFYWCDATFLI